jgi:hypothetical protein
VNPETVGIVVGWLREALPSKAELEKTAEEYGVPAVELRRVMLKRALDPLTIAGVSALSPLLISGGKRLYNMYAPKGPSVPGAPGVADAPMTPFERGEETQMKRMERIYDLVARNRAREQKWFALQDFIRSGARPPQTVI